MNQLLAALLSIQLFACAVAEPAASDIYVSNSGNKSVNAFIAAVQKRDIVKIEAFI